MVSLNLSALPLYLFSKAPVAGQAKRRLQAKLNAEQSAEVALGLLKHATTVLEDAWPGQCVLCATPDLKHGAFKYHADSSEWNTALQIEGDLGQRMYHALREGIDATGAAAVLGTDIPLLDRSILHQAFHAMSVGENVVGPSADGGFYFLGLAELPPNLFDGIEWGQSTVYGRLLSNAQSSKLALTTLPTLPDCDEFDDLQQSVRDSKQFKQALASSGFDLSLLD